MTHQLESTPVSVEPATTDPGRGHPRVDPGQSTPARPTGTPPSTSQATPAAPAAPVNASASLALADVHKLGAPAPKPPVMPADPGLPSDLFPAPLERWIRDTAADSGAPSAMIALPYLAGTGAVIGNRLGLNLRPGWTEYPSLWVALVTFTGGGKTPALLAARQPFNVIHQESLAASRESGDPDRPLIITRGTWHQLQQVLPHTNGLLLHRDELLGLIRAIDRGAGETRQHYLSLWSGDVLNEATHDIIDHPVVSIVGGIQPLLLFNLRRKQHDGFMERFLPVITGAPAANWRTDTPPVPDLDHALQPLRLLRAHPNRTIVRFSPAALDLWSTWYDAQNTLTSQASVAMHGFHRKYPLHLARLILILHGLWHAADPAQPVSRDTVDRAITVIEYLRIQLHRSLVLVNRKQPLRTPTESLVTRIERKLAAHPQNGGWVKRSALCRHLGTPPTALLDTALDQMMEDGLVERRVQRGKPGRPAEEFRLRSHSCPVETDPPSAELTPEMPMEWTGSGFLQYADLATGLFTTPPGAQAASDSTPGDPPAAHAG